MLTKTVIDIQFKWNWYDLRLPLVEGHICESSKNTVNDWKKTGRRANRISEDYMSILRQQ